MLHRTITDLPNSVNVSPRWPRRQTRQQTPNWIKKEQHLAQTDREI
jgi:hypothetical protein